MRCWEERRQRRTRAEMLKTHDCELPRCDGIGFDENVKDGKSRTQQTCCRDCSVLFQQSTNARTTLSI